MQIHSTEEMTAEARRFVQSLAPSEMRATLVALSGDLGAGKTTFVQGALRALGVTEHITSPTFVIQKIYPLTNQQFERAVHIDAYRLKSAHELGVLGWGELIAQPKTLIFVEWPEMVASLIPETAKRVTLISMSDTARELRYEN